MSTYESVYFHIYVCKSVVENHFASGLAIVYSRTGAHAITAINACKGGRRGGWWEWLTAKLELINRKVCAN